MNAYDKLTGALIGLAKNILEQCISILGFSAPEKM